jgi:phage internal scaffolding protein|nr:MAG TPA: Scaffold protein [Microviridae sp.]
MKFKINHTNATAEGIVFTEPSMTQQHFKDETMIDNILQKYAETGFLTDPFSPKRPIQFGDFSGVTDFQTAQNAVARATEYFESLPSYIRSSFNNSPSDFLQALNDPEQRSKLETLGFIAPEETKLPEPTGESKPVPTAEVKPSSSDNNG